MYAIMHRLSQDNELALGKEIQCHVLANQSDNSKKAICETKAPKPSENTIA
jgi:hypothetical protein